MLRNIYVCDKDKNELKTNLELTEFDNIYFGFNYL